MSANHKVGTGTPGSRLKSLFHKSGRGLTLKQFVKDQFKAGNPDAKAWYANKAGKSNQKRNANNIKRILLEKQATKLAKKSKPKNQKNQSTNTTTTPTPATK